MTKDKTAGGCPAASYFFLLRQNKVAKEKATPVCCPCGVPSISRKQAGLRNSHDPLRGHVLKQCSPNPTARLRLIEAAHRGLDGAQRVHHITEMMGSNVPKQPVDIDFQFGLRQDA